VQLQLIISGVRNGIITHGVVLFDTVVNEKAKTMSLTADGDLWAHVPDDVFFAAPGFISANLVSRCGWQPFAENATQNNARVEVLQRIRDIGIAVERLSHTIGQQFPDIYAQLRSPDPESWAEVTLPKVAQMVNAKTNSPLLKLFAVHKQLMSRPGEFVATADTYITQQQFRVRPKAHIDRHNAITEMIRLQDPALNDFAGKARSIITASRQLAIESWNEKPSLFDARQHLPKFSGTDIMIIKFLQQALREVRTIQQDPYNVPVSGVLRKIGMHNDRVDDSLLHRVLVDLGTLAPWQDLTQRDLGLDDLPESASTENAANVALVQRGLDAMTRPGNDGGPLGPEDFYPVDPLESLRHDFGDMPAYVIDDADAKELDDSISFEPIPAEPDSAWIHVHIADPTSILPPDHVLANQARVQGSTVYLNHRTWPMIPPALSENRLSLGGLQGKSQCVLSFSFKVDENGALSDYKVRAGLVRNMITTRYDDVDKKLGLQIFPNAYPFRSSEQVPPLDNVTSLSPDHVDNLRSIYDISRRLFKARLSLPTFSFNTPLARVSFDSQTIPPGPRPDEWPASYRGFPSMTYSVMPIEQAEAGARSMVSEMMKAANRVASRFCVDRNIPILRRACGQILTFTDEDFQRLLRTKDAFGQVDFLDLVRVGASHPAPRFTTIPEEHWSLGVPAGEGYSWVTSPLRRYIDLLGHWQIKHALLHPQGKPLFSESYLQEIGNEQEPVLRRLKAKWRAHNTAWAMRYIDRALNAPSGTSVPAAQTFGNLVAYPISGMTRNTQTSSWTCKVLIPTLGIRGSLDVDGEESAKIQVGESVPVQVRAIRHGIKPAITFTRRV
jgi:exoribonuclease II